MRMLYNFNARAWMVVGLALALIGIMSSQTFAQYRGRGDDRGGSRDPSDFLKRMDANNNGMIDPDEVRGYGGSFIVRAAEQAGMDKTKPLSIEKLSAAMKSQRESSSREEPRREERRDAPSSSSNSSSRPSSGPAPASGFGGPGKDVPKAQGFGPASDSTKPKTGASSSATPSSDKPAGASEADKTKDYAKALLNQYDKNKSGVLEKDEWKEMKEKYHSADANGDTVITVEELAANLAGFAASSSSSAPASGPPAVASSGRSEKDDRRDRKEKDRHGKDKNDAAAAKKPYRVATATELLPKGLPDWFARDDVDGDGQVMMSEYLTSQTEQMAAEFAQYDRNNDGVITPAEALAVEKEKTTKKK